MGFQISLCMLASQLSITSVCQVPDNLPPPARWPAAITRKRKNLYPQVVYLHCCFTMAAMPPKSSHLAVYIERQWGCQERMVGITKAMTRGGWRPHSCVIGHFRQSTIVRTGMFIVCLWGGRERGRHASLRPVDPIHIYLKIMSLRWHKSNYIFAYSGMLLCKSKSRMGRRWHHRWNRVFAGHYSCFFK